MKVGFSGEEKMTEKFPSMYTFSYSELGGLNIMWSFPAPATSSIHTSERTSIKAREGSTSCAILLNTVSSSIGMIWSYFGSMLTPSLKSLQMSALFC